MITFTELGRSLQCFQIQQVKNNRANLVWADVAHQLQTWNTEVSKGNAEHSGPLERENIRWSFILWQYVLSLYTVIWELSRNLPLNDLIDNRLTAKTDGQVLNSLSEVLCHRQKHTSPQTVQNFGFCTENKQISPSSSEYLWIFFYLQ